MKNLLRLIAIAGLAAVIVPPILYLAGSTPKETMHTWMLVGTIVWFVAAPLAARFGAARS